MHVPLTQVFSALQRAVGAKDAYTTGHNLRVARYAANLGRAIGLADDRIRLIEIGSLLHDVGKIGIPDTILLKPTRLTPREFVQMQKHSDLGFHICQPLGLDAMPLKIVRQHHERLDGSGYPAGLRGSQIPLEVQVVGIVDVADALLTHRVYREAFCMEKVWEILDDEATRGMHDRALVDQCIREMASGAMFAGSALHAASRSAAQDEQAASLPQPAAAAGSGKPMRLRRSE